MSPSKIDLMVLMIEADRRYWKAKLMGEAVSLDMRGIEVGTINRVDVRTARSLCDAGLAEMLDDESGHLQIYLGSYDPYEVRWRK